jgi:hypothetical protein
MSRSVASRRHASPVWWSLLSAFITVLLLGSGGVWYVQATANAAVKRANATATASLRESEKKQCTVYVILDHVYATTPPTTETGRAVATAIHRQAMDLHCYDKVQPTQTPRPKESR